MKLHCKYLYQFLLLLSFACTTGIQAQHRHLKLQASADIEYTNLKYSQALTLYKKIVSKNADNVYVNSRIADCYWRMRDFSNSLLWYQKIKLSEMDSLNMDAYIHVLMANNKYEEAKKQCKQYIDLHEGEKKIGGLLQHLQHLDLFFRDSANWRADFININSDDEDFSPVYYNKGLVFVSNRSGKERFKKHSAHSLSVPSFCKIYYVADTSVIKTVNGYGVQHSLGNKETLLWEDESQNAGNKDLAIRLLNMGVKTRLNIGPVTFSSDGKTAYYNWNGKMQKDLGVSRLELFSASYINGKFSAETSFPFNGDGYSVEHPSLSPDGKFLYFASNKRGGVGAFDIYSCKRKDSSWSTPQNLGKLVNTDGNEMFPFADAQGNLYFASDGWPGLGALDIFYVKMKDGLPVGAPFNLGYPINSSYDDFGIAVAGDNTSGYFSSNRRDGNDDLYRFSYLKSVNENVKVTVLDTVSRLRTDGVIVNKKEEKETINNWSVYGNDSLSNSASRLMINRTLVNRDEDKFAMDYRLVYVVGTVLDSITKLRVDGVTIDMKEVDGTDNFHFITNNSGNFGANWKNECVLDIVLTKPGYHTYHIRVNTEQLRNHFVMVFLRPGIDNQSMESVVKRAPVKIVTPDTLTRNPVIFEDELKHLTDSLHSSVIKRYIVYYNLGSATIGAADAKIIDSVARIAKVHPEITVMVAGFTDCRGDSLVNMQLAKRRAGTVRRLLEKLGLSSSNINTEYFGKKKLVRPCSEGRLYDQNKQRMNRRSEIVLTATGNANVAVTQKPAGSSVQENNVSGSQKVTASVSNKAVAEHVPAYKPEKSTIINNSPADVSNLQSSPVKNADRSQPDISKKTAVPVQITGIVAAPVSGNKTKDFTPAVESLKIAKTGTDKQQQTAIVTKNADEDNKAVAKADSLLTESSNKEQNLVEEMSKRVSRKPILLYTKSDSVHIEMYDNGEFDNDTISVIYNGKLVAFKQLLQTNKPISFYVKVDRDDKKNEMIFFADNLGLIPPNSALMVITDGEGKRTEVSVTNDMAHNAVIYFIKPKR